MLVEDTETQAGLPSELPGGEGGRDSKFRRFEGTEDVWGRFPKPRPRVKRGKEATA